MKDYLELKMQIRWLWFCLILNQLFTAYRFEKIEDTLSTIYTILWKNIWILEQVTENINKIIEGL